VAFFTDKNSFGSLPFTEGLFFATLNELNIKKKISKTQIPNAEILKLFKTYGVELFVCVQAATSPKY